MRTTVRPRPLRGVAAACALATLTLLAACGGGNDDDVTASDEPAEADAASDSEGLQECLADQGVELPEGFGDGGAPRTGGSAPSGSGRRPGGTMSDEMRAALEACGDVAPGGFGGRGDPAAAGAYRDCLAENGVELPEPASDDSPPSSIDQDDPDSAAAQEACGDLRPNRPSTTTSTTEVTP